MSFAVGGGEALGEGEGLALEEVHKRADHMHAEWRRIHRGDM